MADIKQIRLNGTEYNIRDARIVSGFLDLDETVEIKGKMVVVMCYADNDYTIYINGKNMSNMAGGLAVTFADNTCTLTGDYPDGTDYIAIIEA